MPSLEEIIESLKDDIKQLEADTGRSPTVGVVSDLIDMEASKKELLLTPIQKASILGELIQGYDPSANIHRDRKRNPQVKRGIFSYIVDEERGELRHVENTLDTISPIPVKGMCAGAMMKSADDIARYLDSVHMCRDHKDKDSCDYSTEWLEILKTQATAVEQFCVM